VTKRDVEQEPRVKYQPLPITLSGVGAIVFPCIDGLDAEQAAQHPSPDDRPAADNPRDGKEKAARP